MTAFYGMGPVFPPGVALAFSILAGLMFGSFASALCWRIPRGFSWAAAQDGSGRRAARSQCPQCGHSLSAFDLIPVLSWLMLRGRCRYCRAPVGWRYPAIEAGTAAACAGIYMAWGLTPAAFVLMAAMPFLVALLVIDMEHMILPDQLNLLFGLAALLFLPLAAGAQPLVAVYTHHILSALLYGGVLAGTGALTGFILRKEALGWGDVKFAAAAGLWLGAGAFPLFLILAGSLGVVWGAVARLARGQVLFPFGPALIVSFYIAIILRGLSPEISSLFFSL